MSVKQDRQGVRTATDLEQKYQFGKKFAELMGIATDARESVDSLASTLRSEMKEQETSIIRDTEKIVLTATEATTKKIEEVDTRVDEVSETVGTVSGSVTALKTETEGKLEVLSERITASVEEYTEKFEEVDGNISGTETALRGVIDAAAGGISMTVEENTKRIAGAEDKIGDETEARKGALQLLAGQMDASFSGVTERFTKVDGTLQPISEAWEKHFEFGENGLTIKAGEFDVKLRLDNGIISFYKGEIDASDLTKNRFGWWNGVDFYTGNIVVELNERLQVGPFAYIPRSNGSMDFLKVGGD